MIPFVATAIHGIADTLVQCIGRLRDIGDQRLIIDDWDKNIPSLERQFKLREGYYRKLTARRVSA